VKWVLISAGLAATLIGCDDGPPPGPREQPRPDWTAESTREAESLESILSARGGGEGGELIVRLAFGAHADLDLFVTGPSEEAVYYASSPSAIGGRLVEDPRCVHAAPRVEKIHFPAPLAPGRYRVGIDYSHVCGESKAPAPFALAIDAPGASTTLRGLARPRVFEAIVYELEIEGGATMRTDLEVKR